MKLTSILIILLFAFTLAACGGGGSSRVPDSVVMPYPVDLGELMLEEGTEAGSHEIAAGMSIDIGGITFSCPAGNACTLMISEDHMVTSTGGMVTAMAMIPVVPPVTHVVDMSMLLKGYMVVEAGEYMIEAGMMMDVGHATFSCPAGGDACTVTVNEDGTATSTGGMATAMPSQMAKNDKMKDDDIAMHAEAMRVAEAIGNDPANDLNKANQYIGDGATDAGLQQADIAIDAKKVNQYTNPPTDPGETPVVANQFMASDDQAMISGWDGSTHTRSREEGSITDTVVNYTDIKPNSDEDYQEYYADGVTRSGVASTGDPGTGLTQRTVTLGTNISMLADQIMAARFPNQKNQTFTFMDDTSTPATDESMVAGTLHGIPGVFDCDTTCTVVTDDDGDLSTTTGTWTFIPAEPAQGSKHIVRAVTPDTDYMNFGYWLEATTATDGTTSYKVSTYVRGNEPIATAISPENVRGSATYEGPATGMYMQKRVNDDGSVSPLKSGQFTASASLTAHFGQTQSGDKGVPKGCTACGIIAPSMVSSINGMISGFMDSDGNALPATWSVKLMQASLLADNLDEGVFDGKTTGEGTWMGQFFGPTTTPMDHDNDPDTDEVDVDIQPGSVGGTFDGHFSNGHVAGAFAATKQ